MVYPRISTHPTGPCCICELLVIKTGALSYDDMGVSGERLPPSKRARACGSELHDIRDVNSGLSAFS